MKHRFTLKPAWDFDDHKGWDVLLGLREEGVISWYSADHENAKDDQGEGFYWAAHVPHHNLSGGKFDTLEACANDMWANLTSDMGNPISGAQDA